MNQDLPRETDRLDELVEKCVRCIRRSFGEPLPRLALILGSGFQEVTQRFRVERTLEFGDLPGFPVPRVAGHPGRLLLVEMERLPVLVCSGRAHFYEGHAMETIMFPTRVLAAAGVKELLLTNAAGGINPNYRPGEFMLFCDHINFTGVNPLRALCREGQGDPAFLDLTDTYSPRLARELRQAARAARIRLHQGVYLGVSGPTYETPAEIRAFRRLGADAVGMSTIPEVLMARWHGLEVAAVSCITNHAAGMRPKKLSQKLSHEEVLASASQSAESAARWLGIFAGRRSRSPNQSGNTAQGTGREKI